MFVHGGVDLGNHRCVKVSLTTGSVKLALTPRPAASSVTIAQHAAMSGGSTKVHPEVMDRPRGTASRTGGAGSLDRPGREGGEREKGLEEWEHQVAEREREADERERVANARERLADERERDADARERVADEGELRLGERSARLRQRSAELLVRVRSAREQAEQAVEQAMAVLDSSRERVGRAEAALDRAYARAARERANVARAAQPGDRYPAARPLDFTGLADRVSALRERTAAAAAQLAKSEDTVARVHDELAAREPANPEYKRLARQAREAARWARETEQKYSSS